MPRPAASPAARRVLQTLLTLAAVWLAVLPSQAHAGSPYLVIPAPQEAESAPAYRYANMTNEEAFAELDRRGVLYVQEGPTGDVRAPIRLAGRLHGVYFHGALPPEQRPTSVFEILDARMALALDDFAAVLERHDIDEVVHYTMYRPNTSPPPSKADVSAGKVSSGATKAAPTKAAPTKAAPTKAAPTKAAPNEAAPKKHNKAKKPAKRRRGASLERQREPDDIDLTSALAKKAPEEKATPRRHKSTGKTPPKHAVQPSSPQAHTHKHSKRAGPPAKIPSYSPPGTRHPGGLAIDVGGMKKTDGTWLSVANHFHGKVGAQTCGVGAATAASAEAQELRAIACECLDAGVFTYVLTPNFDAAHVDHYHMEIKPGVKWFLYH